MNELPERSTEFTVSDTDDVVLVEEVVAEAVLDDVLVPIPLIADTL